MSALAKQIAWFIAVGCAAAATHWSVAIASVEGLGLPPLGANAVGWLVAFVVSFYGHYRLTFRHGFALNEATYAWLLHATPLPYDVLLAIILLGLAGLTFLASRLWAFRRRPTA